MKKYTFHVGDFPTSGKYLYNTKQHRALQNDKGWLCFYILHEANNCVAFIWFNVEDYQAISPCKAPFGSIEILDSIEPEILFNFIQFIEERLKEQKVKSITIKNTPAIYNWEADALLSGFFQQSGYHLKLSEIDVAIEVAKTAYDELIHEREKRKLRQAQSEKLSFQQHSINDLKSIYQFIEDCRKQKSYVLSMTLEELIKLSQVIPDSLLLFSVQQNSSIAAACIGIRVSDDILYTFYYDHSEKFAPLSPVVLLTKGIYEWCQQKQFKLLDLGTAMLHNQPNFGLLQFKLNIGGKPSLKNTFIKNLF